MKSCNSVRRENNPIATENGRQLFFLENCLAFILSILTNVLNCFFSLVCTFRHRNHEIIDFNFPSTIFPFWVAYIIYNTIVRWPASTLIYIKHVEIFHQKNLNNKFLWSKKNRDSFGMFRNIVIFDMESLELINYSTDICSSCPCTTVVYCELFQFSFLLGGASFRLKNFFFTIRCYSFIIDR